VAEVHQVQIEGEDLLLGVALLELDRDERLLDLAAPSALAGEEEGAGELHGDRGGPLLHLARAQVGERGAGDAEGVDAAVLVEVGVLGGEQGVLQHLGDLALLQHHPALAGEGGEDVGVLVVELGDQARPVVAAERLHPRHVDRRRHSDPGDGADEQRREHWPDPAQQAPGRAAGRGDDRGTALGERFVLHGRGL
jgi:hypothetical protein